MVIFLKKFTILFFLSLLLVFPTSVLAVTQGSQVGQSESVENEVQNQNQTQTQNTGEDQQIQTQTQEQESLKEGSSTNQGQDLTPQQNMDRVRERFQALLQIQTSGSAGEQIKTQARAQIQTQDQIRQELENIESRNEILKFIIGPDYSGLEDLKGQIEQNQLRITSLQNLMIQVQNQADQTTIQEAVQALVQENTSLQEKINEQEGAFSLLGWLFKMFA